MTYASDARSDAASYKEEFNEVWKESLEPLYNDPQIHMMAISVRTIGKLAAQFIKASKGVLPTSFLKNAPLCVPVEGQTDKVRVFTNMVFDTPPNDITLRQTTAVTRREAYASLLATREKDLKNDKAARNWATGLAARKTIRRSVVTTIAKYLNKYGDMEGVKCSDVRDWAQSIQNNLEPVTLKYLESPEDAFQMYENGGPSSCMTTRQEYSRSWDHLVPEKLFQPAMFYHYAHHTRGVWVERNGKCAARTILYDLDGCGDWHYSGVYSNNSEMESELLRLLRDEGVYSRAVFDEDDDCEGDADYVYNMADFSIPGIWDENNKDFVCPFPYVDMVVETMYVSFDIPTKTFKFSSGYTSSGTQLCSDDQRNTAGVLFAKHLVGKQTCDCCGVAIRAGNGISAGSYSVCGIECMSTLGYVYSYDSRSNPDVKEEHLCVHDSRLHRYYNNIAAMEAATCKMYMNNVTSMQGLAQELVGDAAYDRRGSYGSYIVKLKDGPPVATTASVYSLLQQGEGPSLYRVVGNETIKNSRGHELTAYILEEREQTPTNNNNQQIDW